MVRSIRCEIGIEINADKYLVFTRRHEVLSVRVTIYFYHMTSLFFCG